MPIQSDVAVVKLRLVCIESAWPQEALQEVAVSRSGVQNPLKTTQLAPGAVSAESSLVLRSTEASPGRADLLPRWLLSVRACSAAVFECSPRGMCFEGLL